MKVGDKIKFEGHEYKVIEILEEHLLVIRNTGIWPATAVVIPKEPEVQA